APGLTDDSDHSCAPRLSNGLGGLDDQRELAVAANEWSLEADGSSGASGAGHDAQGRVSMDGLRPALDVVCPRVLVRHGGLGRPPSDVIDQNGAWRGERLKPARRVHGIAQDHALPLCTDLDCCGAGEDPDSRTKLDADIVPERG